jgi:ADP-ribose pyrophosphatase YjhB (NUDIX family)
MQRRTYPQDPLIGVGAAVFKDSSVLLIKRGNPPLYGSWSLPGGRAKSDESLEEAAKREVYEECGIKIDVLDLVKLFEYIERVDDGRVKFHYIVFDFNAAYISGSLRHSSDALDSTWVELDELHRYELTDAVIDVIRKGENIRKK